MRFPAAVLFSSVLLLVCAAACDAPDHQLTVEQVLSDPGRYTDQLLEFDGEAVSAVGLFAVGVYDFTDGTGTISVVTTRGLPAAGARFRVRGTVSTGVTVGSRRFGTAIYEEERVYPAEAE